MAVGGEGDLTLVLRTIKLDNKGIESRMNGDEEGLKEGGGDGEWMVEEWKSGWR